MHHQSTILPSSTAASKNKGKRKGGHHFNAQLDKMLSDRMMNITDNKKFCDSPSSGNLFYEKNSKCLPTSVVDMDFIKNNQSSNGSTGISDLTVVNNNNIIKSERLSPPQTIHHNGINDLPTNNSSR